MFVEGTAYTTANNSNTANNSKAHNIKNKLPDKAELIVNHIELGLKLAWKLLGSWQARLPQDEVKSIVGISLCEAANNYDGRPNVQFQTFLFYYLRGRLLREISESVKARNISLRSLSLDKNLQSEEIFDDSFYDNYGAIETNNAESILIDIEEKSTIENSFGVLDSLEKDVISKHYLDGETLIDLAKELGYCRCHLSRVKARALSKLKKVVSNQYSYKAVDNSKKQSKAKNLSNVELLNESYTGGRGRRKQKVRVKKDKLAA